jgi:hypothetical protein
MTINLGEKMNVLKQMLLIASLMPAMANALAPAGKQVTGSIALQGGSDSAVKYIAPSSSAYKVHVFVPKTGTTTNALYRIYPKGKRAGSTQCLSSDATYPCYEASINQTLTPNAWVQLNLNDDAATQWDFVKGKGYVAVVASNLAATEQLNLSALVRFENQTIQIGKTYQGGIIFYIDNTGEHGLVAAPKDLADNLGNAYLTWWNGSYAITGATATAVGTGLANTTQIIQIQGNGQYAASLAANLVSGGYDDWYLPSKDELNLMYHNIGPGAPTPLTNAGGFVAYGYWSSSESSVSDAWLQNFGNGNQGGSDKNGPLLGRAVRAF